LDNNTQVFIGERLVSGRTLIPATPREDCYSGNTSHSAGEKQLKRVLLNGHPTFPAPRSVSAKPIKPERGRQGVLSFSPAKFISVGLFNVMCGRMGEGGK
jgi:hypothetical protein